MSYSSDDTEILPNVDHSCDITHLRKSSCTLDCRSIIVTSKSSRIHRFEASEARTTACLLLALLDLSGEVANHSCSENNPRIAFDGFTSMLKLHSID